MAAGGADARFRRAHRVLLLPPYRRWRYVADTEAHAGPPWPPRVIGPRSPKSPAPSRGPRLGLILVVIALARPSGMRRPTPYHESISWSPSTSNSMWADDIRPNRMEAAREVTKRFLSGLGEDRVGLVPSRARRSPTVRHNRPRRRRATRDRPSADGRPGTNIEAALLSAAARSALRDRTRIIILVTDGEQMPGNASRGHAPAPQWPRVYAIGAGQPSIFIPTPSRAVILAIR